MNKINIEPAQAMIQYLDFIERYPVQNREKVHQETLDFASAIDIKPLPLINRIVSLRYRLNLEKRGEVNEQFCQVLNRLLSERVGKAEKIEEVSRYALFAQCLIEDIGLRNEFFNWAIVFGNEMRPFIEFPATVRKITECGIGARIGFYGGKALQVVDGDIKLLTLPFEGAQQNILDEEADITFSYNYRLKVKEIFQIFSDRVFEMGNLEFFSPGGICNWNPKKLGPYNPATGEYEVEYLRHFDWWNGLRSIQQLSIEQAQERYNVGCDGTNWVFRLMAARERPTTDVVGTHSYLEIAIPDETGYKIYYFGKFATTRFPTTTLQYIDCITDVLPAAPCYPDENIFNPFRDHDGHSALASPHEGIGIMESIRKDIYNSINGNFYFQLLNENCCRWVWKKLRHHLGEERIPELFSMTFYDIEAEGGVGALLARLRGMSQKKQNAIMGSLFFIFGGWRKRTVVKKNGTKREVGILCSPTWKTPEGFLHPPKLFHREPK